MPNRKPDFIIIGAAKAGTTSLYHYLARHPNIFMSEPKEPTYFARDERYRKGEIWYLSLFNDAKPHQLCGEASTNYTNWPLYPATVARMAELAPDAKLIYILRHPVDRTYSHYIQLIQNIRTDDPDYKFNKTFEEHIAGDDSVIQSSNYMLQINQYLTRFTCNQMLFLVFEDFVRDPRTSLIHVADFLGIDPSFDFMNEGVVKENVNQNKETWLVRSRLTAPLKALPGGQFISDHLPLSVRDRIYSWLRHLPQRKQIELEYIPPKMHPDTRARLLDYFKAPNAQLMQFLDRDLGIWAN
ncbi:sulfotransferase domain-containing protein [Aromatoleum anaerobium]|uniref:Sulfotransferase n=1 Tax=Aromatoleum anaerobium TaxID=182180 RepID=A0ABX1PIG7_9RHOO|nr:sulfotransferase domain-containing protein [Aromatoleum anaerobium]MCK0509204.1 sulfotransferase domain-containing protein [Aromatoleum anaerobium]